MVGTLDGSLVFSPAVRSTAENAAWLGGREHAVRGEIEARSQPPQGGQLQFVRIEGETERVVWTFRAGPSGGFEVADVPHGRYQVQLPKADGGKAVRSLPFNVGDGQPQAIVRWPSPQAGFWQWADIEVSRSVLGVPSRDSPHREPPGLSRPPWSGRELARAAPQGAPL